MLPESLPPNFWQEQKKTEEGLHEKEQRLKQLKDIAKDMPNAPFILVEGKGYFEVPAWVVVELTDPGVTLGFPIGLSFARKAFKYLEKAGIILDQSEWLKIKWAGAAKEAMQNIEKNENKKP